MIPDNITGGLIMTVVNMAIMFGALTVIAFVISLIHRLVSPHKGDSSHEGEGTDASGVHVASASAEQEVPGGETVQFSSLDSRRKAAIVAAITAYLGRPFVPVSIRRIPDAGTWGKTSRVSALLENSRPRRRTV